MDQAAGFEELVGLAKMVLYFEADDETLMARLLERGKTSGRADDNEEAIRKRLVTFHTQSTPVISLYEPRGLVRRVNALQSIEEVFGDVEKVLAEFRKQQIVFIFGQPLSGKTMLCKSLARTGMFHHIAMADLLRAETQRGTEAGREIANAIKSGKPVPGHIITQIIHHAVSQVEGDGKIVIDGFPRSIAETTQLTASIGQPSSVIYLDCAEGGGADVMMHRNAESENPADEAKLQARFEKFDSETSGVVKSFEEKGLLKRIQAAHFQVEGDTEISAAQTEGGNHVHSVTGLKLVYEQARSVYGF